MPVFLLEGIRTIISEQIQRISSLKVAMDCVSHFHVDEYDRVINKESEIYFVSKRVNFLAIPIGLILTLSCVNRSLLPSKKAFL